MSRTQKLGVLFLSLLLSAGLFYWLNPAPTRVADLQFTTIEGQTLSLHALRGKPVLVTFWASDCHVCLEEIPDLIKLHQQQSLTIIAVAMPYDPPHRVMAIATDMQLPYAIALDPGAEISNAFGDVKFTPNSFLIDPQGRVIMQKTGRLDMSVLQAHLLNMV